MIPPSPMTAEFGMFTRIAPNPMGRSNAGSIPFLIAKKMSIPPIIHITTCCHCTWAMVSMRNCIKYLRITKKRNVNFSPNTRKNLRCGLAV